MIDAQLAGVRDRLKLLQVAVSCQNQPSLIDVANDYEWMCECIDKLKSNASVLEDKICHMRKLLFRIVVGHPEHHHPWNCAKCKHLDNLIKLYDNAKLAN